MALRCDLLELRRVTFHPILDQTIEQRTNKSNPSTKPVTITAYPRDLFLPLDRHLLDTKLLGSLSTGCNMVIPFVSLSHFLFSLSLVFVPFISALTLLLFLGSVGSASLLALLSFLLHTPLLLLSLAGFNASFSSPFLPLPGLVADADDDEHTPFSLLLFPFLPLHLFSFVSWDYGLIDQR
ncbi:hypothetical protein TRV_00199 [Trichophyton verrucosum HKI 0517]|uniref:Uncharacterized protein n=1 Tax=Trichophyton verrucosum (strain HKI 0517) TaxID=663202 RepID=D4CZF7_TRIVH|nr:uncharacterized protein TRV_00199 [Trichophyton verrucosum HKI 0517]EFE45021.1 hypothetical protein TRV_00199 [Trichophyton verrucosum HKI 0517]